MVLWFWSFLTNSYELSPSLACFYLLLPFLLLSWFCGPNISEHIFLELLPALSRFYCLLPALPILKRSYLLLIFWIQYFPPTFFLDTKILLDKKKEDKTQKKNYIYLFTRVKISAYDLCLVWSSLVGQSFYIQGILTKIKKKNVWHCQKLAQKYFRMDQPKK